MTNLNGATCYAMLIQNILNQYKDKDENLAKELENKAGKYGKGNPYEKAPLTLFNEMLDWIEKQLGPTNAKMIGKTLGEKAYEQLKASHQVNGKKLSPKEAVEKLGKAIQEMVQDPSLSSSWKVVDTSDDTIRLRKTQNFNAVFQLGMIESFIRKAGVVFPRARLVRDFKRGPAFDEYEITWY